MRESHFRILMAAEFGSGYARSVARDQVLGALSGRTADEALAAGVAPATVWAALCEAMDVPAERQLGGDPELPPPGSLNPPGPARRERHH